MFGGSKVSTSSAAGSSASGGGIFAPVNDINFGGGIVTKPAHFLVLAGLAFIGFKAWRKFKS